MNKAPISTPTETDSKKPKPQGQAPEWLKSLALLSMAMADLVLFPTFIMGVAFFISRRFHLDALVPVAVCGVLGFSIGVYQLSRQSRTFWEQARKDKVDE
jgi:hypothetical protein